MCDSMGFINKNTGFRIFAKNSDREPVELQVLQLKNCIFNDQKKVGSNNFNNYNYLNNEYLTDFNKFYKFILDNELGFKKDKYLKNNLKILHEALKKYNNNYKVLLSQPNWLWGAEMGVNEYGVAIGNEAVFSFEKLPEDGLIGMDILRIMLQNAKTAEEALKIGIDLIENYVQGGSGGFKHNMKYHNSYLIQDFNSLYVFETSGKHWAYKMIDKGVLTISNSYTIKKDFNKVDENTLKNKKFKKSLSFKDTYEIKLFDLVAKGDLRHNYTNDFIKYNYFENENKNDITSVFKLLRSHVDDVKLFYKKGKNNNYSNIKRTKLKNSMAQICVHSKLVDSETTSSMVVQYIDNADFHKEKQFLVWFTGSKNPCVSLFKPVLFDDSLQHYFKKEYFEKNYEISNMLIKNYNIFLDNIKEVRDSYEKRYINMVENYINSPYQKEKFNSKVFEMETEYLNKIKNILK